MAQSVQKITLSASRDIPINKLLLSACNVRRVKAGVSIEQLADDIARRTLLQSLIPPSSHCHTPYGCEFWSGCTADKPADWIVYLPRLSPARQEELEAQGLRAIAAIPPDFPLTSRQAVIRDALVSGQPYMAPDLARLLQEFGPPCCYLDFEAAMPPIPLYEGTRPYQVLPFQWSLHTLAADGTLDHRAFLANGHGDPRRPLAQALVAALAGSDLPIIVYSAYERTRLRELALHLPDLAPALDAITARLVDLLPVVRGAVYLPAAGFGNSIKDVAPALAPGFGYGDLVGVADGAEAAAAFLSLASGTLAPTQQDELRVGLLAYCERDTLAMLEVHRALRRLAGRP